MSKNFFLYFSFALLSILFSLQEAFAQTTKIFTNSSAAAVDKNVGAPVTRTVSPTIFDFGLFDNVTDVNVTINFEKIDDGSVNPATDACTSEGGPGDQGGSVHNEDIKFTLTSPNGTSVNIVALNDYSSSTHAGVVAVEFDDAGVSGVGATPASGTFRPSGTLSSFIGETPIGTWELQIEEDRQNDPLCFISFSLEITTSTDSNPPVLQSFTSTSSDGNYGPGGSITIRANYDETVIAGSALSVQLNTGVTLTLNTVSGSSVSGTYVVGSTGSGQNTNDLTVTSIQSQSVSDSSSNTNTSTTLPATNIGDVSTIVIDTVWPSLQSFSSSTANGTYGPGSAINITATYDENIGAGSTLEVALNTGASVTLNNVSGSTISGTYTVGSTGSGQNTGDLTVQSITSQSVSDTVGNSLSGTSLPGTNLGDGSNIQVDTVALNLNSFTSNTLDGTYGPGSAINMIASYDGSVGVGSTVQVALNSGATVLLSNVSGSTISGIYTVGSTGSGENTGDLGVQSISAQSVSDAAGNIQTSTALPATNVSDGSDIAIDTAAPVLQSFSSTTSNGTYGPGYSSINITATYNDTLAVGASIDITLDNGVSLTLNTLSGSTLSGAYTVGAFGSGEETTDLTVATIDAQAVADAIGNVNGSSTLPGSNIADSSDIVIDSSPDVVLSVGSSSIVESASGQSVITATSNAISGVNLVVELAQSGTATSGTDYSLNTTSLTITAGAVSAVATLSGAPDLLFEPDETVVIDIDSVTNGVEGATNQVTVTITDDDQALDSDGDGISNADECPGSVFPCPDSDADGVPDYLESNIVDSDGNGTPDYLDSDSDGDGTPDGVECALPPDCPDSDGDGLPDYLDSDDSGPGDSDGDGVSDADECVGGWPCPDSDGDGIPDYLDTDSDNDGILDSIEGNGDSDGDGVLDFLDIDADNDGIPDLIEGTTDSDGDGKPNYADGDSDNDGVPDNIEVQDPDNFIPASGNDTDGDGLDDAYDADNGGTELTPVDSDGDSVPDYLDPDSDGDGVPDSTEAHDIDGDGIPERTPSGVDANNNGIDDAFDDIDSPEDLSPGWRGGGAVACGDLSTTLQSVGDSATLIHAEAKKTLKTRAKAARRCGEPIYNKKYKKRILKKVDKFKTALETEIGSLPTRDQALCQAGSCATFDASITLSAVKTNLKKLYKNTKKPLKGRCISATMKKKAKKQKKYLKSQYNPAVELLNGYPVAPIVCE